MRKTHRITEEIRRSRQERIETFRLMTYVIILGIFVNAFVSFLIRGNSAFTILFLILIIILFGMTVKHVILTPSVISDEFPTILVLDCRQNVISLPCVMKRPELAYGRVGSIGSGTLVFRDRGEHPFVINAFSAYLVARKDQKPDLNDDRDMFNFFDQLIVYLIIQKYFFTQKPHILQVGKIHTHIGPFLSFGSYPSLPSEEVSFSKLAEEEKNMDSRIAQLYKSSAKFAVPKGMQVTLLPPNASDGRHKIRFHHKLITLTISVGTFIGSGGANMEIWPREMLGNSKNLYALGSIIEYEVKFHNNLRRIRLSSELEHICAWVSDFIENLREYVRWYDEDIRLKNQYLIDFVGIEKNEIIYSLREQGESGKIAFIRFKI